MFNLTLGPPKPNPSDSKSFRILLLISALFGVLCAPNLSSQASDSHLRQNPQEVTTLELGKPVARELSGRQNHVYQLVLAAGQYANVTVAQPGIDLSVKLFGVDGKLIAEFDNESRNQGRENLELVAEAQGNYRLEISPTLKSAPTSRYEIRLNEARTASARDRSLYETTTLFAEASRLFDAQKYDDAIPFAERASQILEQIPGAEANSARALNLVANLYSAKRDYAKAEALYSRALQIRENLFGVEHPDVAASCHDMARSYVSQADTAKAETFVTRALTIRENVLDANHSQIGLTLNLYATLLTDTRNYAKAQEVSQRAVSILEKSLGDDSMPYCDGLHRLGYLYDSAGDFVRAEELYRRELAAREKAKGKDSLHAVYVLHYIARINFTRGEYDEAESIYQRTLEINEKLSNEKGSLVSLSNLAMIHSARGDYQRGEDMYKQVLERKEKEADPSPAEIAFTLLNLGAVNNSQGDYEVAEQYLNRSLAIVESGAVRRGADVGRGQIFTTLAGTYMGQGDYTAAEEAGRKALALTEKINGPNHPYVAMALNLLGRITYLKGDITSAESLYLRALGIAEKAEGTGGPDTLAPLKGLSQIYAERGDVAQAIELQSRANNADERRLAFALATGSERQKLTSLAVYASDVDRNLTLNIRYAPADPRASELAAMTVLRFKGRVLDAMTDTLSVLRSRAAPADKAFLDQLNEATSKLARRILNSPPIVSPENLAQTAALEKKREELEDEISRRSAEFRAQKQSPTLDSIRRAMPEDAALIEFVVYRPFNPKASNERMAPSEPRYVVYVIRKQGEVFWTELGAAKEIENAVDNLRRAQRDPRGKDVQQLARLVDEKLMRPVRALTGGAKQLIVSPHGELSLIPFEALVDEQGRYLIERYAFSYVTSGRDLLRMQVARESQSKPTVFANPSFGEPEEQVVSSVVQGLARNRRRRSVTNARSLSEVYFAPLGGTAQEGRTIQTLYPETNLLTGSQATESTLKEVAAPRVLHLATHGFFLQGGDDAAAGNAQMAAPGKSTKPSIENPLLRSGLALAGANLHGVDGKDDGILTALEASGLNLWGTKLVVLSACDTGVGEVRNGEGVYGLRRAFLLAGAESLVMSLWPVNDYSTRNLMIAYYKNLKLGLGRGAALRQVQLDLLKRNRQLHPFYWANFIQSGEWANLNGKR